MSHYTDFRGGNTPEHPHRIIQQENSGKSREIIRTIQSRHEMRDL